MEITTVSNLPVTSDEEEEKEESVWSFDVTSSEYSGSMVTSKESDTEIIARKEKEAQEAIKKMQEVLKAKMKGIGKKKEGMNN